jgi:hypothetical protein
MIDVGYWPVTSFCSDGAIQSLSERSGHPASRSLQNRFYELLAEANEDTRRLKKLTLP